MASSSLVFALLLLALPFFSISQTQDLISILEEGQQFTTLIELLKTTESLLFIENRLASSASGLTLFAPTDNAFANLPFGLNQLNSTVQGVLVLLHVSPKFYTFESLSSSTSPLPALVPSFSFIISSRNGQVTVFNGRITARVGPGLSEIFPLAVFPVSEVLLPGAGAPPPTEMAKPPPLPQTPHATPPEPSSEPIAPEPPSKPVAPPPDSEPVAPEPVSEPITPEPASAPVVPEPPSVPAGPNLVSILAGGKKFTTLIKLLNETEALALIEKRLKKSEDGLTLLAPTDDAFENLSFNLDGFNSTVKAGLVLFHTLSKFYTFASLSSMTGPVPTVFPGYSFTITTRNDQTFISYGSVTAGVSPPLYKTFPIAVFPISTVLLPSDNAPPPSEMMEPPPGFDEPPPPVLREPPPQPTNNSTTPQRRVVGSSAETKKAAWAILLGSVLACTAFL